MKAVQWERIIVDEAHQEPGLMNTVMKQFPAMAKYCVTGTPYSDKVSARAVAPPIGGNQ